MADIIKSFTRYCGGSKVLASLILGNVLVFIAVWIAILTGRQAGLEGNFTMPWLCVSSLPAEVLSHPWTPLTYMVVQYDFIHLLFNLLWLFWFGVFIPFRVSERRRLSLYIGGGLAGAIFYVGANLIWSASATGGYLCGASAAVLAVMTAVAIWSPRLELRLILFGKVQMRWVALACIVLTFFGLNGGSGAAQSAHIGGVVFGVIFALLPANRKATVKGDPVFHEPRSPRRKVHIRIRRDGKAVAAAAERLSDVGRLDQLLDKIRMSGYSSLSAGEKNELTLLSQRIDKKQTK